MTGMSASTTIIETRQGWSSPNPAERVEDWSDWERPLWVRPEVVALFDQGFESVETVRDCVIRQYRKVAS